MADRYAHYVIEFVLSSGRVQFFSDQDNTFTLVDAREKAKCFATRGSAERFLQKLRDAEHKIASMPNFRVNEYATN